MPDKIINHGHRGRPAAPFVIQAALALAALVLAITPCTGMPSRVAGRRLTLTPRADPPARSRNSADRRRAADGGRGGHGGGATSVFDMSASSGFDLSSETIEICTSAARCGTFGRATPGWRPGDPVPDELASGPRRYWWGHDGNSTLNLITHGIEDQVFGSMVDGNSGLIYSFGHDAEGVSLVRATPTSQFSELPAGECATGHGHHERDQELPIPADTESTTQGISPYAPPPNRKKHGTHRAILTGGACLLAFPSQRNLNVPGFSGSSASKTQATLE